MSGLAVMFAGSQVTTSAVVVDGATNIRLVPLCCQTYKWYVVTEVTKDFTVTSRYINFGSLK